MNDTLIILHLPQTGGTTLRDILSRQYPEKWIFENKTLRQILFTIIILVENPILIPK